MAVRRDCDVVLDAPPVEVENRRTALLLAVFTVVVGAFSAIESDDDDVVFGRQAATVVLAAVVVAARREELSREALKFVDLFGQQLQQRVDHVEKLSAELS